MMVFVILEKFQQMDKKQAATALSCVKIYIQQSERTKKWTDVLVKLKLADPSLLPKFDNVPSGFIALLEDHIKNAQEGDVEIEEEKENEKHEHEEDHSGENGVEKEHNGEEHEEDELNDLLRDEEPEEKDTPPSKTAPKGRTQTPARSRPGKPKPSPPRTPQNKPTTSPGKSPTKFSPAISKHAQSINRTGNVFDALYNDALQRREKKKAAVDQVAKDAANKPRSPQISKLANKTQRTRNVFDSLYDDAKTRRENLEKKRAAQDQ